jgi:pimeloyl-ACP methyl ester carboxylesterase
MKNSTPRIVLVHGAFADATGWQRVIPLLERDGLEVTAVQNPLTSLAEDIATTRRVIDAEDRPMVVVGHSYGGAVISGAAAGREHVKALVYVAAFAPDVGESVGDLLGRFAPSAIGAAFVPDSAGFLSLDRAKFHDVFAKDVPEETARIMAATQKPIAGAIFSETASAAAWRSIPSWYLLATQDRSITPELQRFLATRMQAKTSEVESSHVPFVSRPEEVAKVVQGAVRTTLQAAAAR